MKEIRHIFFDLDNTLWDYRQNAKLTLVKLYEEFDIYAKFGYSFDEFYPYYYESNEQLWADFRDQKVNREELRRRRFPEAFANLGIQQVDFAHDFEIRFVKEVTQSNYLVQDAELVLNYLSKRYKIHVLTNGFQKVSEEKINGSSVGKYIQTFTTAEEAGFPKPDNRAFEFSINKADASKDVSIYIGDDWKADIEGAVNFGMRAIFFNPLHENHLWISEVPVIENLKELMRHL